jgi:hypothetical protein
VSPMGDKTALSPGPTRYGPSGPAELATANFHEKALFVKADLAASSRPSAAVGPFALCFYSHSRGALLVARCIG